MKADPKQAQAPTCIQITERTFTASVLSHPSPGGPASPKFPGFTPLHNAQFEGIAINGGVQKHSGSNDYLSCNTK